MFCCCAGCIVLLVAVFFVYKIISRLLHRLDIGKFDERYILVTGCDTGFGNLLAKRLDQLGCHVFAGCLTEKGGTELTKCCSSRLKIIIVDVSKPQSVRDAYKSVTDALPRGKGVWAVVNNAGISGKIGAPEWLTVDDYKETSSVNLYGLIDVTMTFLPLIKLERGRVINTSSLAGRMSTPPLMPYSVSKYGVESFSDGLRRAMHPFGVKVIIMEPGWTTTPLTTRGNSVIPALNKAWQQASQQVKDEYGEEYFNFCITKMFDSVDRMGSTDPLPVVDALQHAVLGRYPKYRYVTGIDGNYIILPLQAMPEWFSDFVIRVSQLKMPLPAAVARQRGKI